MGDGLRTLNLRLLAQHIIKLSKGSLNNDKLLLLLSKRFICFQ
jgi:hypothetical protein